MNNAQSLIGPGSAEILTRLQNRYGTADWSQWAAYRKEWWSFIDYPAAGATQLNFFGTPVGAGGTTYEDTNIPKAGSFGQVQFILKSVKLCLKTLDWGLADWDGTDAETYLADLLAGFVQGGTFTFDVVSTRYIEVPQPFQVLSSGEGQPRVWTAGLTGLTLVDGTPNTLGSLITSAPWGTLAPRSKTSYQEDPNIYIEADQTFSAALNYPSGAIPIIATGPLEDAALQVGCLFTGIELRPVQ